MSYPPKPLSKKARRAAAGLSGDLIAKTAKGFGAERPDLLDAIAHTLLSRARELRIARAQDTTEWILGDEVTETTEGTDVA